MMDTMDHELDADERFWLVLSELSLAAIWDNEDDDIYAELLTRPE